MLLKLSKPGSFLFVLLFLVMCQAVFSQDASPADIPTDTPTDTPVDTPADDASPTVEDAAASADQSPKPQGKDRTILTVDGKDLKAWQIDAMLKHRAARDQYSAAQMWMDIQINAAEARRRGLDKTPQGQFILQLFQDSFLARMFTEQLSLETPQATEQQAREKYQQDIETYKRPFSANVQHIRVTKRDLARRIIVEAHKPDAKFEQLYQRYSEDKDKRKGLLSRASYEMLSSVLGPEAADAVKGLEKTVSASNPEIMGPFTGNKGFEIVKVNSVTQPHTQNYDSVKERILMQLNNQIKQEFSQTILNQLRENAEITRSQEFRLWQENKPDKPTGARTPPARRAPPAPAQKE